MKLRSHNRNLCVDFLLCRTFSLTLKLVCIAFVKPSHLSEGQFLQGLVYSLPVRRCGKTIFIPFSYFCPFIMASLGALKYCLAPLVLKFESVELHSSVQITCTWTENLLYDASFSLPADYPGICFYGYCVVTPGSWLIHVNQFCV